MPNQDDTDTLLARLKTQRQTLAHYLQQQALLGIAHTPPGIVHGITKARRDIAQLKTTLRGWGTVVDDHPDDMELADDAPARNGEDAIQHVSYQGSTAISDPARAMTDPARYGPQVIVASDCLEDRESHHSMLLAYYMAIGVALVLPTINTIIWLLKGQTLWLTVLSVAGTVVVWIYLIVLVRRQFRQARASRKTRQGATRIVELLRTALDHHWTIYCNLQLPDQRGDFDLVLIGPGGIWITQVQAVGVLLRFQAGSWEYQHGQYWVRCDPAHDPAFLVMRQAKQLQEWLKGYGILRSVKYALALAERQPIDSFAGSDIPVWLPGNLAAQVSDLTTGNPPTDDEVRTINTILRQRADEQRAVEEAQSQRRRKNIPRDTS